MKKLLIYIGFILGGAVLYFGLPIILALLSFEGADYDEAVFYFLSIHVLLGIFYLKNKNKSFLHIIILTFLIYIFFTGIQFSTCKTSVWNDDYKGPYYECECIGIKKGFLGGLQCLGVRKKCIERWDNDIKNRSVECSVIDDWIRSR